MLSCLVLSFLVSGCVAGQKMPYAYDPVSYSAEKLNGPVEVAVSDERPYILDHDKEPSYVGHFRAVFGNTWDVKTKGEIPLAEQFQGDLEKEMEILGGGKASQGNKKTLRVKILDYNCDAYLNVRFWYKFALEVYDSQNQLLAKDEVAAEKKVKGSFWWGPSGTYKKQTPILYAEIIRSLVRENKEILDALKS